MAKPPSSKLASGSNHAFVHVVRSGPRRAVVVSSIDNLGKGAAGQAVQNMNVALGLPETAGLDLRRRLPVTVRVLRGGITTPVGFRAGAARAGLRLGPGPDAMLVVSDRGPVPAAATFTDNRLRAAPVELSMRSLRASGGHVAAVVANAGCANAGTGPAGLEDARAVQSLVADRLGVPARYVLTASTGLIGSRLGVDRLASVLPELPLARGRTADLAAANAIMTTDTRPKEAAVEVDVGRGRTVRIGGMAKGSGMIHPQMGTMLAFCTTDAPIGPAELRAAAARGRGSHLQPGDRRRRPVDERHGRPPRQRGGGRRHAAKAGTRKPSPRAWRRCADRSPSRSRPTARARSIASTSR